MLANVVIVFLKIYCIELVRVCMLYIALVLRSLASEFCMFCFVSVIN